MADGCSLTKLNGDGDDSSVNRKRKSTGYLDEYFELEDNNYGDIKVMTSSGKMISLKVQGSDFIREIKLMIKNVVHIPSDQQELVFNGMILEDINTLANMGIKKGSIFTLLLKSTAVMTILINAKSASFSVQVTPTDTIKSVKAKIDCTEDFLTFNGLILEDNRTLADFNIVSNSVLTCIGKAKGTMEIYVTTFTGKTISLLVSPTDTIADVKSKIQDKEHIAVDEQALIFNKMVLGHRGTLYDFYINRKSTLTLMRVSNGFMHIFIKNLHGSGNTVTVEVKPSDTLHNLKSKVHGKEGVPPYQQTLMIDGRQLREDGRTLAEFNIRDGTTVQLSLSLGGPYSDCR